MTEAVSAMDPIEGDIWAWMREFVAVKNEFYDGKFPPCPYALRALMDRTVDVVIWRSGDVRAFISRHASSLPDSQGLSTRVMAFAPRVQGAWGLSSFVEALNAELIPRNVFLNTGVAKTTSSRYPASFGKPYFIVVANSLDAVLRGADALQRTDYYARWPTSQFEIVVRRRARMALKYQNQLESKNH